MPERFSPVRLFVTLLALIFCIEMAMMLALHYLFANGTSVWAEAIADATVLTAVTSVFVWRLFMRPLRFALMSETAQAKAVMDAAAEGIITVDERGRIESFNHAAQRMFGYEAAEALGKNVKMLMPEPHASNHDGYIARYLRTGEARVLGPPRGAYGASQGRKRLPDRAQPDGDPPGRDAALHCHHPRHHGAQAGTGTYRAAR